MTRSKPNGRLCMFLVGASLIVIILLSYKWFMVPSGVQKERKSALYYRQQRLQKQKNERNSFGKDRGRNFFNDRSLTGNKKWRYQDDSGKQDKYGRKDSENKQQFQNNKFELTTPSQKVGKDWEKDKGSEENVGQKITDGANMPVPKQISVTSSPGKELSIKSLYRDAEPLYTDMFNKMIRIVHLDLKGSPPNMEYLKKLLPFFKKLGATGLLIEYEDMFPYTGKLSPLAAKNCYSTENIATINQLAVDNSLDVIPLIQTFGHMEFALKSGFSNLRESEKHPLVIHPGLNETYDFLFEMIDQVMKLHSGKRFLHIGSDEVHTLGKGRSRNMLSGNTTKTTLYFKHVKRVAKYVRDKHAAKPLIWDDMFRHVDVDVLKASKIGELVSPIVWSYVRDPRQRLPKNIWKKYRTVFPTIWIASAFKGATGVTQYATDALHHIQNHLSWVDILKKEVLSDAGTMRLTGVALTGWSRYDHFAVMCELLPAAIPSLAASLQIMSTGGFSQNDHKKISDLLQCNQNVQLELCTNQTVDQCEFPGNEVYYKIRKFWRIKKNYSRWRETYNGWVSDYNIKYGFSSPFQVQKLKKSLISIASNVSQIEKFMWNGITALYDNFTAAEWIDVNLRRILNKIPEQMRNLNLLMTPNTWKKRPFEILISPPAGIDQYQMQQQSQNQVPGQNQGGFPRQNQVSGQNQGSFPRQNQVSGQNQGSFQGQNQIPGQNQGSYSKQNQGSYSSQNQMQRQGSYPGQIQAPGQNQISGQSPIPGQNQFGRRIPQNDLSGRNPIPGQSQPTGPSLFPGSQGSAKQFPGQNQLPGQQQQQRQDTVKDGINRLGLGQNNLKGQGQYRLVGRKSQLQGQEQGQGQNQLQQQGQNQLQSQGQNQTPGQRQNQLSGQQRQDLQGEGQNKKKSGFFMSGKNFLDSGDKKQNMDDSLQDKTKKLQDSLDQSKVVLKAAGDKKDEREKELGVKKQDMSGNTLPKPPSLNIPVISSEKEKKNQQEREKMKESVGQTGQKEGDRRMLGGKKEEGIGSVDSKSNKFSDIGKNLVSGLNDAKSKRES